MKTYLTRLHIKEQLAMANCSIQGDTEKTK